MAARHRNGLNGRRPSPYCPLAFSNRAGRATGQERLEVFDSARLGGGDELGEKAPLFLRMHRRLLANGHVLPRTGQELAGIDFADAKNVRNLTI